MTLIQNDIIHAHDVINLIIIIFIFLDHVIFTFIFQVKVHGLNFAP